MLDEWTGLDEHKAKLLYC